MPQIQYENIVNAIGHWVWEVDASGVYTYCSENVTDYLGYESSEIIGKTPFDFMSNEEAKRVGKIFENIVANKEPIIELENIHINRENQEVTVVTNGIPIFDDDGELIAYQGFDRDISKQKELEKRLETKRLLLIQQSRLASMGEMIANISHQWKQPLNALSLLLQKVELLYNNDVLTKEQFKLDMKKSKDLVLSMSDTINAFRDFFRNDKYVEEFTLTEAIDNAYSILESDFNQSLIKFHVDMKEDITKAFGNKNELSQVLINIFNNAKDVLVEKKIQNPEIGVSVEKDGNRTVIKIYDNAGGIPKENLHTIFDPYFTTKNKNDGTGIGLYMSRMIIEETFKGELTASNCDQGACFKIAI